MTMKTNDNENSMTPNLWDPVKAGLRGKFPAPKLIQLLIFLSPCTSLRAILFHFQLLTSLHFSLAYFVDVVLTFLKDPVPWGKSPPLVLYFCSLQII